MDPTGPSQPPLNTAYDHPSNPASHSEYEQKASNSTFASIQRSDPTIEQRERGDVPVRSSHGEGPTPSSLGYGVRDSSGDAGESVCWFDLSPLLAPEEEGPTRPSSLLLRRLSTTSSFRFSITCYTSAYQYMFVDGRARF